MVTSVSLGVDATEDTSMQRICEALRFTSKRNTRPRRAVAFGAAPSYGVRSRNARTGACTENDSTKPDQTDEESRPINW
jgi:hypothetical protein